MSAVETRVEAWVEEQLACPRNHDSLRLQDGFLVCSEGHRYPVVDGIPIMVLEEAQPTQEGYWATPEELAAHGSEPAEVVDEHGVDPYVAELIVGTCGNLYRNLKLDRYPIPDFPLPEASGQSLLDIGCNWGRWTISAARNGYTPIGIDPSLEAIVAARRIAAKLGVPSRYVVADARYLPFPDAAFDVVFSYGVLQHFSKEDVAVSVREIARTVRPDGYSWVQMPNAFGLRNLYQVARRRFREGERFEVRYWTPRELRRTFGFVGPTSLSAEGFFTLNAQKSDIDLLPRRYRLLVRCSEALRRASRRVGFLTSLADSVNVRSAPRPG